MMARLLTAAKGMWMDKIRNPCSFTVKRALALPPTVAPRHALPPSLIRETKVDHANGSRSQSQNLSLAYECTYAYSQI